MPKKESLPVGVGRVPEWWMELTPHYVLDLEDDEQNRRMMEENEALYCAQMLANDDGRLAQEWKSSWGGRSTTGGGGSHVGGDGSALFGGRNFQPGSVGWDPKQWGIDANDPDYKSYLKGAKLPQSYIDAMMEFANQVGIKYDASSLNATGGKYGSSGGKPAFTPAWAKKKLRATGQGAAIRHGIYNDSPNKHMHRVNAVAQEHQEEEEQQQQPSDAAPTTTTTTTTNDDLEPPASPRAPPVAPPSPTRAPPSPARAAPPSPARTVPPSPKPKWKPPARTPPPPAPAPAPEYTYNPVPLRSNTPAPAPAPEETEEKQRPKYSFKYVCEYVCALFLLHACRTK